MEEEVELVGTREDFLSEDDHSPTDASEDSVEVKVTPIKAHYRPLTVSTQPLQQQKATVGAHQRSLSPPSYKFHHKFRKHYAAFDVKQEYELKARSSPQDFAIERHSTSPHDFSRSRESPPPYDHLAFRYSPQDFSLVHHSTGVIASPVPTSLRPRTPTSPVDSPMGAAPLSPGTRAAGARSRRKPAEPRRVCHDGVAIHKRAHSPEPPHKAAKVARTEGVIIQDDKSVASSSPSPGAPPLMAHHPLLGPLARPPIGAFPPLLLPPAWPPVATQWGYPRVVTPLGWAGLTPGLTPHHYPMLIPHPYPLSRPLLHPHLHPTSPPPPLPKSPPPPRPPSEEHIRDDLPIPLVTKGPPPLEPPACSSSNSRSSSATHHPLPHHPPLHPHAHHHHPAVVSREVSVVKKVGKAPSKFLSVESLIATDKPSPPIREATTAPAAVTAVVPQEGEDDASTSLQGEDDETIHSLMQPNKQKQRNYKNMTRERRIEANARERNRVHTISAAFEKLRTSVPAYSHNQKLSKLSVLRIACSYILLLSRLAGSDYSEGGTEPSISECVDLTTRTIQVEGKAKKKRDE